MPAFSRIKKHITIEESDVTIITDSERYVNIAIECLIHERNHLKKIIKANPQFQTSFSPVYTQDTSELILQMQKAAEMAHVGPMASVAGVLADLMCERMISKGAQIAVVENGGEIMIHSKEDIHIGLYSHTTQVKNSMGFLFKGGSVPLGIGTSSGTFGHATSLGRADTVTIFAQSAGVADAAATIIANSITRNDTGCILHPALKIAQSLNFIHGLFITCGENVAKTGKIPEIVFSQ